MKIAIVVHDFDPGFGQGRYCWELARRMARDHSVHVFANTFGPHVEPGLSLHAVPAWRRNALTTVLSFLPAAERLIHPEAFDIVHAQGVTCWRANVITAHVCNAARRITETRSRVSREIFDAIVCPLERRFYRQRNARHLIAVSNRVAADVRRHYGWSHPTTIVHHGTDTERFRPAAGAAERRSARQRYELSDTDRVWLFVGEAAKGLTLVIAQLPHFPDAKLLVVSRSRLDDFKQEVGSRGCSTRVLFHGPEADVAQAYRASDAFVYPSAYDAFGLVATEAMASGLPVVVGKDIGATEWIEHGRNGLLCDPRNPASLRTALSWLSANPVRALEMGAAARATIEGHTWDACAAATVSVYERVLRERSSS